MHLRLSAIAGLLLLAAASPALAIDCAKAKDPVSKAICADPALKAADDAMSAAYATLRGSLADKEKAILKAQQLEWLRQRDGSCGAWEDHPVDEACLLTFTEARTRMLSGTPEQAEAGAPAFQPAVGGLLNKAAKVSATLLYPQSPDAADFNAALREAAEGDGSWRKADSYLVYDVTYRIPYASAEIASVVLAVYWDGGGAHPNGSLSAVTWLGKEQRLLQPEDLVAPDQLAAATAFCKEAIAAVKRERGQDESDDPFLTDEAVAGNIQNAGNWWITAEGANVHYNAYDVGAYAEGDFDCTIPWAKLKEFAPKDSPLPFRG